MNKTFSFRSLILVIVGLAIALLSYAGPGVPKIKVLSGNQIAKDTFSIVEDEQWYDPANSGKFTGAYYTKSVVSLRIRENANLTLPTNFAATIPIRITVTYANNTVSNFDEVFNVYVQPNTSNGVRYILSRTYENVYRVHVKIGNYPYNSSTSPYLEVVNELYTFPSFRLPSSANEVFDCQFKTRSCP